MDSETFKRFVEAARKAQCEIDEILARHKAQRAATWIISRGLRGNQPRYYTDAGDWSTSMENARGFPTRGEAIAYAQSRGWAYNHSIVAKEGST